MNKDRRAVTDGEVSNFMDSMRKLACDHEKSKKDSSPDEGSAACTAGFPGWLAQVLWLLVSIMLIYLGCTTAWDLFQNKEIHLFDRIWVASVLGFLLELFIGALGLKYSLTAMIMGDDDEK